MIAGTKAWETYRRIGASGCFAGRKRGLGEGGHGWTEQEREGQVEAEGGLLGSEEGEEDRQVAHLLSYKRIIDVRLASTGRPTSMMPGAAVYDHAAFHAVRAHSCHASP